MADKLDLLIVSAFPNTPKKQLFLFNLLDKLSEKVDVLLVSHFPVSANIQQLVRYYIYDNEDVLLNDDDYIKYNVGLSIFYHTNSLFYYQTQVYRGGINCYSNWKEIQAAFSLASSLKKRTFAWLCYDIDLSVDDIPRLLSFPSFLGDKKAYFEQANGEMHFGIFSGCFWGGEIDWVKSKLPLLNTKSEYLDYFKEFFIHEWMLWKLFGQFSEEIIVQPTIGAKIVYLPDSKPNQITIDNPSTSYHANVVFNKEKTKIYLVLLGMCCGFVYNVLFDCDGTVKKETIPVNKMNGFCKELVFNNKLIITIFDGGWERKLKEFILNSSFLEEEICRRGFIQFL